ncbi:hypothetical protein NDU88_006139 [Pleurodeles waltl]|uniref:Uncharacterized protein n=1 Tax=Pleurodeles waltl TaxID=8319 RepID=A0AAV7WDE7_PLEWA|nr:hypothetical protein NDU88_006139 [Pleurodeles waltl]
MVKNAVRGKDRRDSDLRLKNRGTAGFVAENQLWPAVRLKTQRTELEKQRAASLMEAGEITTRAAWFSDHRAAGFLTQVPLLKQRKACPDLRVLTGSAHHSPAERRNDAPRPAERRNDAMSRS